ncbi:hypothetical protein ACJJTC_007740 [Scirpophaga incertulas]
MMTRRATALCTEQKLRQALEELKHTKETCSQLLRERDESEIEIQKIIARNTQLKSELSQLHAQHVDVLQHQENLNETISCYDQQYSYERTLQRITDLEKELSVANNQIAHYKELEQLQDTVHTENLYQELVRSPGGLSMLYQPLSTNKDNCPHVNNLNFDNSVQCSVETGNLKLSKNKFKKYVKVRKFICADTVEQRIDKLQQDKLGIADSVLTGAKHTNRSKLSIEDLQLLFNMGG